MDISKTSNIELKEIYNKIEEYKYSPSVGIQCVFKLVKENIKKS